MALARLALRKLCQRVLDSPSSTAPSFLGHGTSERAAILGGAQMFSTEAAGSTDKVASETSDGKQVSVSDSKKSKSLFPRRYRKRGLWRRNQGDFPPALFGTRLFHLFFVIFSLNFLLFKLTKSRHFDEHVVTKNKRIRK